MGIFDSLKTGRNGLPLKIYPPSDIIHDSPDDGLGCRNFPSLPLESYLCFLWGNSLTTTWDPKSMISALGFNALLRTTSEPYSNAHNQACPHGLRTLGTPYTY